jgi:hypothetical protein
MAAVDGWSGDDAFTGIVVGQLWKLAAVFQHSDGSVFSCQKDLSVSGDGRCEIGAGIANAAGPILKFAGLQVSRGLRLAAKSTVVKCVEDFTSQLAIMMIERSPLNALEPQSIPILNRFCPNSFQVAARVPRFAFTVLR